MDLVTVSDPKEAREWLSKAGERHPVLDEVELLVFRGSALWVLHEDGTPLSYRCFYVGKKKSTIWQPYVNSYTAYTVESHRRKGLARYLSNVMRKFAVKRGCRRLKSLAGTKLGLLFHASLGDVFWGITENLEVVVDSPLVDLPGYAGKVPPSASKTVPGARRMSLDEILGELGNCKLRYDQ